MNLEDQVSKRNDSNKKAIEKHLIQVFGTTSDLDDVEKEQSLDKLTNYLVECKFKTNYAKAIFNCGRQRLGISNKKNIKIWLRKINNNTTKSENFLSDDSCLKIKDYCTNLVITNKPTIDKLSKIEGSQLSPELKKFCSRYYFALAFLLSHGTGLRISDNILLKRCELERMMEKLVIYQKKTGNPNIVLWLGTKEDFDILLTHWPPNETDNLSKYLSTTLIYESFREIFKAAIGKSKPKGLGLHSLRYKTATRLWLDSAQQQLGHSNKNTTLGYVNSEITNLSKDLPVS
jgi:integrase